MSSIIDYAMEKEMEDLNRSAVRNLELDDLILAAGWMKARYGKTFPIDFFARTGLVYHDCNVRRAVIPVYFDATSTVAVAGHCMANPENSPRESHEAITSIMAALPDYCRRRGRKYLIGIYGADSVNRIADRAGFQSADVVNEKIMLL